MAILQTALNGLSRRWRAIPPAVRRTHWPATLLCVLTGLVWGSIVLRIDEVVLWERDSVHALDTWSRAWDHGVVFDTVATAIGIAIGLELVQRIVRIVAWDLRAQIRAESPVPFPDRNLRFTACYACGPLFFVMLLLAPFLGIERYISDVTAFFEAVTAYAIIISPFEAFHAAARFVAWEERKRAERAGEPWPEGPVRFSLRAPRRGRVTGPLPPRYGDLTCLAVLTSIICGSGAALDVLTYERKLYAWRELVGDTVLVFTGTFIVTFVILDWVHQVIRAAQGPGMHISPTHPPPPPRPPLRGPVSMRSSSSDDAMGQ